MDMLDVFRKIQAGEKAIELQAKKDEIIREVFEALGGFAFSPVIIIAPECDILVLMNWCSSLGLCVRRTSNDPTSFRIWFTNPD